MAPKKNDSHETDCLLTLADDIYGFFSNFDPYEYKDCLGDLPDERDYLASLIREGKIMKLLIWLAEAADGDATQEETAKAQELILRLFDAVPVIAG